MSKRNDVVLAFLLICVVFMMILPLPTALVDVLIAINLCISAILLMGAIYLADVVRFSAFPSILLLTTLFRLALSITTTRLILLQADAGQIVETFGNFVLSGNLVVGAVIVPILTIDDGLVSQIPALFIAITAGFIVTRVSSEDNENLGADIARQLIDEPKALIIASGILIGFAFVPGFPTVFFLALAAMTGLGGLSITRGRRRRASTAAGSTMPSLASAAAPALQMPVFPEKGARERDEDIEVVEPVTVALTVPLIVDISSSVRNCIQPKRLDAEVAKVRRALYFDLGVPFPGVHLRLNGTPECDEYRILVNEIPVAAGKARPGFVLVRETEANLRMFDIPFERGEDFLPNAPSLWVATRHKAVLRNAGIQMMTLPTMPTEHLRSALNRSITHKFSGGQARIPAYLLSKTIEDEVRGAIRQTSGASYLALSPDTHRKLIAALKASGRRYAPARGQAGGAGADRHPPLLPQDRRA